jgi:GntR family transcriptional regulator/MocR family aminotransferase
MDLIKEIISIDVKSDIPVYIQIANAFIQHIANGRLRKGLRLPGSREAAAMLHINRMTVVAAYNELDAQGWIETIPKKGSFVRKKLPVLSPQKINQEPVLYSLPQKTLFYFHEEAGSTATGDFPAADKLIFNDGFPDPRIAPVEQLISSMRSSARLGTNRKFLMYGGPQGTILLREALSSFLADTRGLPASTDNILITNGAQMGLYIAASILITPGDHVIVGEPGYVGANNTFQQLGARLIRVPVDEAGIDVAQIADICKKKPIKIVYVIPHHHNPTTVTLSPARRIQLLELSVKYKFAIIEDDYDYDFHYSSKPILPIASLDQYGSVIYIGTFSKTIAPAIRAGFVVAPQNFIRSASYFRKIMDTQGDSLMENALAGLFQDGTIARHIKRSVKLYKERRDHFCNLLKDELSDHVSFKIPDGGMSVWATFLTADLATVATKALKQDLILSNGKKYDSPTVSYNSTRLGFTSLHQKEQEKAVKILQQILSDKH